MSNISTASYEDDENKEEEKIEEEVKEEEGKAGGNTSEKDKEESEKKGYTMNFGVSKSGKGGGGGDAGILMSILKEKFSRYEQEVMEA